MGFIKVFEKLDMYNHKGSLEGWIRKIIVNTALDNIRKNKKLMNNVEIDKVDYQLHNNNENAIDILSAQDLLMVIQDMPTGFRTVFNMYVIEGYSHKEIGEELNISINTSKSQFSRARAYLQKILIKEKVIN
jgi:RNA polymerase sigma factor (sigma-70 family)